MHHLIDHMPPLSVMALTLIFLAASRRHISGAVAAVGIFVSYLTVSVVAFADTLEVGDVEKMAIELIALALPVVLASGAYLVAVRLRPAVRLAIASAAGAIAVGLYVPLLLGLICSFVGDCL